MSIIEKLLIKLSIVFKLKGGINAPIILYFEQRPTILLLKNEIRWKDKQLSTKTQYIQQKIKKYELYQI